MAIADRQGDVILIDLGHSDLNGLVHHYSTRKLKPKRGRYVLAEGEATGHAHTMVADKGVVLLRPSTYPPEESLLVVTETTVQLGSLIEGKVLETMPGGSIRFQQTDGTVIRFNPSDITVEKQGARVKRAFTPLKHDEHDAIPVSRGAYRVVQHHTFEMQQRTIVSD